MEAELHAVGDYSIDVVHRRIDEGLRAELVAFWTGQGAIADPAEAWRRADEVVCVARDAAGAIAAVNSVYAGDFRAAGDRHYFYRQFARPQDRRLRLGVAMLRRAVDCLRAEYRTGDAVKGIVLVAENPKLSRKSGRRLLAWLGWTSLGKGPRGFDLWRIGFERPQSPAPP